MKAKQNALHAGVMAFVYSCSGAGLGAGELESQVLEIFDKQCSSCHEDTKNGPVLTGEVELSLLRADNEFVVAGDAGKSLLFELIDLPDDDSDRMPKSTRRKPLPPLSAAEKETIRSWIAGANVAEEKREFITREMTLQWVTSDVESLKRKAGLTDTVRYLDLSNLYNKRDAAGRPFYPQERIRDFHFSISKLLNSLSWYKEIILPHVVDVNGTLVRFDLAAYGIDYALWDRLFAGYPYHVDTGADTERIEQEFGPFPLMRADFFVFAMAQPPFYHQALRLPGDQNLIQADMELERKVGIVLEKAIQSEGAVRGGFQVSGVSQGNRVIERLPHGDKGGYFWKSYDFDRNRQNERGGDLFRAPLGPGRAALSTNTNLRFSHDGGEIIFSLPNGLQAYMLTDQKGGRIDEGPLNVVSDASRSDGRIINGVSCMSCHVQGMISAGVTDEVRKYSENVKMSLADRKNLERLYDDVKLKKWLKTDAARYQSAVKECGTYSGKKEAVRLVYDIFRQDLTAADLPSEFGVEGVDIVQALERSGNPEIKILASKFRSGAPVPRLDFRKEYRAMVDALGIGKAQVTDELGLIEFGGYINQKAGPIQGESATSVTVRGDQVVINPIRLPPYSGPQERQGGFGPSKDMPKPKPKTDEEEEKNGKKGEPIKLPPYQPRKSKFDQTPNG